jgi:hypothetical protein
LRSEPEPEDPGSEPEDPDPDWGLINEPENGWSMVGLPGLQALRVVVGTLVVVIEMLKAAGTTALAMMNDRTAGTE